MLGSVGRLAVLALPPLSSTFEARVLSRLHLCYPNFMLTCAIPMTSSHSTLRPLCICNRHLQKPLLSFRSRCVFAPFLFLFLALASGLSVPLWGCQFHWNWQRTLRTLRSVYRSKPRYRHYNTQYCHEPCYRDVHTHAYDCTYTLLTHSYTHAHARTRTHTAHAHGTRTHTHAHGTHMRTRTRTHAHAQPQINALLGTCSTHKQLRRKRQPKGSRMQHSRQTPPRWKLQCREGKRLNAHPVEHASISSGCH